MRPIVLRDRPLPQDVIIEAPVVSSGVNKNNRSYSAMPYGITFENVSFVAEPTDNTAVIDMTFIPIIPLKSIKVDVVMKRDVYTDPVTRETKFRYSIEDKNE